MNYWSKAIDAPFSRGLPPDAVICAVNNKRD